MACKPGSVPGKTRETAIHLGRPLPNVSRDRPGQQAGNPPAPPKRRSCPYLVLLRVGFAVPRPLPAARCALTAPFHPYLIPLARAIGGLLSVALVVGFPPRRYLAPCPMEPGLSSPPPVSPEEDDDEAATVWSASARSIEGLRALVTPRCAFQSPVSRRYYVKHGRYCHKPRGMLRPTYLCWSIR